MTSKGPLDRALFAKLMQRTKSDNDAEALAAIRAANRMLADRGLDWGKIVPGANINVASTKEAAPPWVRPAPRHTIPEALDLLYGADMDEEDRIRYRRVGATWDRRKYMDAKDQRWLFELVEKIGA